VAAFTALVTIRFTNHDDHLTLRGGVRAASHPVALWRIASEADRSPNHLADQLSEYYASVGYRW
jgi:hypothetical protein